MYSSSFSNFSVYYDNLSAYYICTILLSFLAVFITWWLLDSERKHPEDDTNHVGPAHTLTLPAMSNVWKRILMLTVVFMHRDYWSVSLQLSKFEFPKCFSLH